MHNIAEASDESCDLFADIWLVLRVTTQPLRLTPRVMISLAVTPIN
jgi:hypothetical protein